MPKRKPPHKLTKNAQRCKKYRQKDQKKYREDDALRKRKQRVTLATTDPSANQLRLKKQAEKKKEYRIRQKLVITSPKDANDNINGITYTYNILESEVWIEPELECVPYFADMCTPQTHMIKPTKRDAAKEKEALDWVEAILGEPIDRKKPFEEVLKNGIILCDFINKLLPGAVKKIERKGTGFVLMQNLERFQAGVKKYGVPETEVFQTVDLYERKNIPQVVLCLFAIGRVAQTRPEYSGPILGPKMAEEHKRDFSQEQLDAGKNVVSLQYGSNKGASQAGLSMGKQRMIND